jgi:hypothetical protein
LRADLRLIQILRQKPSGLREVAGMSRPDANCKTLKGSFGRA